ncbi:hypothetical protein GWI33_005028 [Rhynchophorus ferrugineus]|uniref:Uncharacterized protein n=1 Tax=Rhynchophorus ferrugineus TaxID=354439 RepID=A0A834IKX8_RHYFE|nr:hypothetical protein GWI33_005028 [Rhynchophorus ferrugineus]
MDKKEFRVLIKYCFLKEKKQLKQKLDLMPSFRTLPQKKQPSRIDLAPRDYFLLSDLKRMLTGKKFSSNEEVIVETEANFGAKDKTYYKNGIEKLSL